MSFLILEFWVFIFILLKILESIKYNQTAPKISNIDLLIKKAWQKKEKIAKFF